MKRVLVLRPEPGAAATVRKARERGLDAIAVTLFEVEPVEWQAPNPAEFDALLLTSANTLRHGGKGLQTLSKLPAYAVGETTAEAARRAGFEVAGSGSRGVEQVLNSLDPGLKLLHLCGEDRIIPTNARQAIAQVVVYRSREVDDCGDIPEDCVALIHSPRAGRRFAELVGNRSGIAIAAISRQAAEAVGGGWETVDEAETPTDDALLALAARLCNKQRAG